MRLEDRRILFDGTHFAWDVGWTFFQMLAVELAARNEVVYLDRPVSFVRGRPSVSAPLAERPSLRVLRVPTMPAQRTEALRRAGAALAARGARRFAAKAGWDPDLVWATSPRAALLLDAFPQAQSVYWTGDDVTIPGEDVLLRRADAILCVSDPVFERHRAAQGERAHFMPVACDFDRYNAARDAAPDPLPELAGAPRPYVGYVGFVGVRLDLELLAETAGALGGGTLLVAGPAHGVDRADLAKLAALPNVVVLGGQPPGRVPQLMGALDAGLIPYVDTAFNRNSNPVKFYEYLALGVPVVSTEIPTLRRFEGVASVGRRETFVERLRATLRAQPDGLEGRRIEIARDHSFAALLRRLEAVPA